MIIFELRLATPFADNETDPATAFMEFRARPYTQAAIIVEYSIITFLNIVFSKPYLLLKPNDFLLKFHHKNEMLIQMHEVKLDMEPPQVLHYDLQLPWEYVHLEFI